MLQQQWSLLEVDCSVPATSVSGGTGSTVADGEKSGRRARSTADWTTNGNAVERGSSAALVGTAATRPLDKPHDDDDDDDDPPWR